MYILKFFFVPHSLKTTRNNHIAPPIMVQSKKVSPKILFLCITNKEIVQNSKSKPKKLSFLCTFLRLSFSYLIECVILKTTMSLVWMCVSQLVLLSPNSTRKYGRSKNYFSAQWSHLFGPEKPPFKLKSYIVSQTLC